MPAPPETMRTSAVQRRSDFRKKVFGPPILRRSKRGANVRSSQKPYFRKSRRQLHPAVSDLPKSQIRARSASPLPKQALWPHARVGCTVTVTVTVTTGPSCCWRYN